MSLFLVMNSFLPAYTGSGGEGTAGKLLTDQQLYDRFNSVALRIDKLATDLEQGQGTAGQLLHDKRLYETMNDTASELKELLPDRVLVYSDDGEAAAAAAHQRGLTPETVLVRRSSLEDVFLRLTGRSLDE